MLMAQRIFWWNLELAINEGEEWSATSLAQSSIAVVHVKHLQSSGEYSKFDNGGALSREGNVRGLGNLRVATIRLAQGNEG